MPSARDWDQMLKAALDVKGLAQKFIDFAHMNGAGKGGEGEEDLAEQPEEDGEDSMIPEDESAEEDAPEARPMGERNKKAAIIIAIGKKKGKGK